MPFAQAYVGEEGSVACNKAMCLIWRARRCAACTATHAESQLVCCVCVCRVCVSRVCGMWFHGVGVWVCGENRFKKIYTGKSQLHTQHIPRGITGEFDIMTCRDLGNGEVQYFRIRYD